MVKDPKKLRKNYFNSKYVIFDVLSILPTGYSLSEALILASINPTYDDRVFVELKVLYKGTKSSVHVVQSNVSYVMEFLA